MIVGRFMIARLAGIPAEVDLGSEFRYRDAELARDLSRYKNFLFLGRGSHYPSALEGALKLKKLGDCPLDTR